MKAFNTSLKSIREDILQTLGAGVIPYAILAQCFHKNALWIALGVLLLIPMIAIGAITIPVALVLTALQIIFAPIRLITSGLQDLITPSSEGFASNESDVPAYLDQFQGVDLPFANYINALRAPSYSLNNPGIGSAWDTWNQFKENARQTLGAGVIPYAILAQCFRKNAAWVALGALLTIPMVAISLVTIPTALLLASVQAIFVPLQLMASKIQDWISPPPCSFIQDGQSYDFSKEPIYKRQFECVPPTNTKGSLFEDSQEENTPNL